MKSFIVAAFLVAAVAGQSLDTIMKLNKEKTLLTKFDRPMSELMLKQKLGYPWEKTWTYGDSMEYTPEEYTMDNKIYHNLEEIMEHPLMREYMTLPLFRQWIKYPAFQKFVTSVYFQKFWHMSAFKAYFYNPVLFYKYIYPIVTLFKSDVTYPYTHNYYGDEIENKNLFPVSTGYERDLLKEKYLVPTMYNEELKLKDELLLKHLIVKIYSHMYNIPEEIVFKHFLTTDKIFNPMTEEYKTSWEPMTWESKFWGPKTWEPTMYGDKLNKEVLLKKYLLNREETIKTPEEVILREKMMKMPLVHRMLVNKHFPTYKFDTVEKTMFDIPMKKEFIKDEMTKELIKDEMKKELIKDELKKEMYLKEKMNEMNTFETFETPKVVDFTTPMMKVRTFEKKVFPETIIKA